MFPLERSADNMHQIWQQGGRIRIGALQIAIAVCTLTIAFVYLYLAILPDEDYRFWFVFDGLGYLGMLAIFFLPRFAPGHLLISLLLMGYALLTIVLWDILGQPDALVASVINPVELLLAVLAFYESWRVLHIGGPPFI